MSHPTWVRGLKLLLLSQSNLSNHVAPYVGAWIETILIIVLMILRASHPTWVRGLKHRSQPPREPLRLSHPTWVRGLKHRSQPPREPLRLSHPTWVRGLKHMKCKVKNDNLSRTLRGCVD